MKDRLELKIEVKKGSFNTTLATKRMSHIDAFCVRNNDIALMVREVNKAYDKAKKENTNN